MTSSQAVAGAHAERLLAILQDAPAGARRRVRILVADIDPGFAEALNDHLRLDAEIVFASSVEGARELLAESPATLVICNPAVAGDSAWRFCSQLADHGARAGMPVIVLKRTEEIVSDVELYLLGIDVVLGPPVQRNELVALVRSQLRKLGQQRRSVLQDAVTGHPTVAVFQGAYQRAASLAAREHEPLSLVVLHVGALDRVRGKQGAEAADEVLRVVAGGAADTLRQSDLLARGNGDSFLMLLPNTDATGAERVIEKIHDRLQRTSLLTDESNASIRLMAGVTEVAPKLGFEQALESAVLAVHPVQSAVERAVASEAPTALPRTHRILLAEDDALTASIIRHRLEHLGHEVLQVVDGSAVLTLAPEVDVSLLILDVKMPYVDGFEALRRLRSIRSMRDLPIMMLTSMGNEEDIARGFELGANDYLVKPFSPIELQARIQRLLR